MLIDLIEYTNQALITVKKHDSKEMAICDWCLGLCGELGEVWEVLIRGNVDKMNLAKELGDILWYTVALGKECEVALGPNLFYEAENIEESASTESLAPMYDLMSISMRVGKIHEIMKHYIMHKEDKALDKKELEMLLSFIILDLHSIAAAHGATISMVAYLNVSKLAHRFNVKYGGTFNTTASSVRHTTEEKFTSTEEYKKVEQMILGAQRE